MRFISGLACMLLLASAAAFTEAASNPDLIIGQVVDETGDNLEVSRDYVAGARVYFDFVNSQGGVSGRRIALVVKDDGGRADRTVGAARDLLDRNGAHVLFGHVGDAGVAALVRSGELRKSGSALVAPLAGLDIESGDQVFFLRPTYRDEVLRTVDWLRSASLTRAALVYGTGDFARETREAVVAGLRTAGIELVADVAIGGDGSNAGAVASRVAASQAQLVLVLAETIAAGQFVRSFRAKAPGVSVVGMSNINQKTLLELAGPEVAYGTLLVQVVPDPYRVTTPIAREHAELFRRFRDEPQSHATLEGFIAAKYLVATLRRINGAIDRASILAALRARRQLDLGGYVISWPAKSDRGSRFTDMTFLRKDGTLLH